MRFGGCVAACLLAVYFYDGIKTATPWRKFLWVIVFGGTMMLIDALTSE